MACFKMYQAIFLITLSLWVFEGKCMYLSHQFADSPVISVVDGMETPQTPEEGCWVVPTHYECLGDLNRLCHLYKTICSVLPFFGPCSTNRDWFMHKRYWSVLVDLFPGPQNESLRLWSAYLLSDWSIIRLLNYNDMMMRQHVNKSI